MFSHSGLTAGGKRGRTLSPSRLSSTDYSLVLVLLPEEEPPCCGRTVVEELPEPDVLPLELLFTSVRLRVETVPVVSGALERVRGNYPGPCTSRASLIPCLYGPQRS
jgi:hypothetical protein